MDSSFTPDPQGILSAALSAIVLYLHQNERDKGHWERLRRIILNDLNTVMSDGQGHRSCYFLSII